MAFQILSQAGKVSHGIKEYMVDTYEDLLNLEEERLVPGCTAIVINASEIYMLNTKREWKKIASGINPDLIYDGGEIGIDYGNTAEIIYDGGDII